jgi:hypothetical protein
MSLVKNIDNSPIVKCSHCKQVFASEDFDAHECDLPISRSARIEVVYFRDDSYKNKKLMTGLSIDGVLYTLEIVPRKPIPFILQSSDGFLQREQNRRNRRGLDRTFRRVLSIFQRVFVIPSPYVLVEMGGGLRGVERNRAYLARIANIIRQLNCV